MNLRIAPAGTWAPPGRVRLVAGPWSLLLNLRPAVVAVCLLAALVLAVVVALSVGTAGVTLTETLPALLGHGDDRTVLIVRDIRAPRVEAGIYVGAAFGISGLLLQTIARNRLATPDVIGINNGATAFAVASVTAGSVSLLPSSAALMGAASAASLALLLAGGSGAQGYRFIIVGVGIGAVMGAVTSLLLARAPIDQATAAFPWTIGTLNGRPDGPVRVLSFGLAFCGLAALLLSRHLRVMQLPGHTPVALGVRVATVRAFALALAVILAGLAVAVGGPLGLVALIAPDAARRLAGLGTIPIVGAALMGAVLVVLGDTAGRLVFSPVELPVGLVTSVAGAPYLLWLILARTGPS